MRIVRFQKKSLSGYGAWEESGIREIHGSIYGAYTLGPTIHRLSDVRLLSPVEPTKVLCVGLNFRDHIEEIKFPFPQFPAHFLKPLTTVVGPDDPIVIPRVAQQVDYEGELAVVIKDTIKNVAEAEALHERLSTTPRADDRVAAQFGRLVLERRERLLAFLGDARRREAIENARRPRTGTAR